MSTNTIDLIQKQILANKLLKICKQNKKKEENRLIINIENSLKLSLTLQDDKENQTITYEIKIICINYFYKSRPFSYLELKSIIDVESDNSFIKLWLLYIIENEDIYIQIMDDKIKLIYNYLSSKTIKIKGQSIVYLNKINNVEPTDVSINSLIESIYIKKINNTIQVMSLVSLPINPNFKYLQNIRILDLSSNRMYDKDIMNIFDGLKDKTNLLEIDLRNNFLTGKALKYITPILKTNNQLLKFNLSNNLINNRNINLMAQSYTNIHKTDMINLEKNKISFRSAKILCVELMKLTQLMKLILSNNDLKPQEERSLLGYKFTCF